MIVILSLINSVFWAAVAAAILRTVGLTMLWAIPTGVLVFLVSLLVMAPFRFGNEPG